MNFLKFAFLFLGILMSFSCETKPDLEVEKQAIKKVIEDQTRYYMAKDHDKYAELFVQDESLIILVADKEGYGFAEGWELADHYNNINFKENPDPDLLHFTNENYKIKIYNNAAWAVYDEMVYKPDGDLVKKIINVRFLEKINGSWKIVYLGDVNISSYR